MLDKLIKYDLKAGGRIISVIYLFMLLCAVFVRITGMLSNALDGFIGMHGIFMDVYYVYNDIICSGCMCGYASINSVKVQE